MFLHLSVCPQVGGVPGQVPPWADTPLGPGTPPDQVHPLGPGTPPGQVNPPPPPGPGTPQQTATVADGTHPTGMHSCFKCL